MQRNVGTNIGAGQQERTLRVALTGRAIAFAMTETGGLAAALRPIAWLRFFGSDPSVIQAGSVYLQVVRPTYGFFGLGLSLYFTAQGAGRLLWPLLAGLLRLVLAVGGGWIAPRLTGSLVWLFAALGVGLVAYGVVLAFAIASGAWFEARPSKAQVASLAERRRQGT